MHDENMDVPTLTFRRRHGKALFFAISPIAIIALVLVSIIGCRQHDVTTTGVAVTTLSWSPRTPRAGQEVFFHATLRNRTGFLIPAGTQVRVHFGVDGAEVSDAQVVTGVVMSGGTITVTANHGVNDQPTWTTIPGRHFVVASADIGPDGASQVHSILRRSALLVVNPVTRTTTVRIMPLGDSITSGNHSSTSYRYFLWKDLVSNGFTNIDFVGSLHGITSESASPPDNDWDEDHEGHSGWRADEIVDGRSNGQDELAGTLGGRAGWANVYRPDIVLVDLGANDLEQGRTPDAAMAAVERVINVLRAENPHVEIALAELSPDSGAGTEPVAEFNDLVIRFAVNESTLDSPIVPVDCNSAIDQNADLVDGVHLTDGGNRKMADQWYPVVARLIKLADHRPANPEMADTETESPDESRHATSDASVPSAFTHTVASEKPL